MLFSEKSWRILLYAHMNVLYHGGNGEETKERHKNAAFLAFTKTENSLLFPCSFASLLHAHWLLIDSRYGPNGKAARERPARSLHK